MLFFFSRIYDYIGTELTFSDFQGQPNVLSMLNNAVIMTGGHFYKSAGGNGGGDDDKPVKLGDAATAGEALKFRPLIRRVSILLL
jgi:hypothetical protein